MSPHRRSRPVAIVACEDSSDRDLLGRLLADHGYGVVVAQGGDALLAAASLPARLVIVDAPSDPDRTVAMLVASTAALGTGCRVLALHEADDVAGMWRSFRLGAHPVGPPISLGVPDALAPHRVEPPVVVLDALHLELGDRSADACARLARLSTHEATVDAVEAVMVVGARALERLHGRSRFLVPTDLFVDRIPDHVDALDGEAFSDWWTMFEAVAFRAAGLQLPLRQLDLEGSGAGPLFGAFHATAAILRFTARRQWRQPVELLGDLGDVSGAGRSG